MWRKHQEKACGPVEAASMKPFINIAHMTQEQRKVKTNRQGKKFEYPTSYRSSMQVASEGNPIGHEAAEGDTNRLELSEENDSNITKQFWY